MFSLMSLRSKRSTSSRHGGYDSVVVRLARPEDEPALRRVAALDDKRVPAGHLLVAEADSELIAALPIAGGAAIADPFRWTSEVVALMQMRAAQLTDAELAPAPAGSSAVTALRTQLT
jgi:hypothetical protein